MPSPPTSDVRATQVSKDESYTIELDPTKAAQGRDAFCKALYQRIFDHLVSRVNLSLGETMENSGQYLFIGLLDVFGFEIFELNSFEQVRLDTYQDRPKGLAHTSSEPALPRTAMHQFR